MTREEREDLLCKAKKLATEKFNNLPFETRKDLANSYDRYLEVNLLLHKGENLSIAFIKKRKRELENTLIEWYIEDMNKKL